MSPPRTEMERALASAAEEPLATVREDREHFEGQGDASIAAVLAFLAEHLFDDGVTAAAAARAGACSESCCWAMR